jgi:hypothetical protein
MTEIFKLIQENLFCQSFDIWSINSISRFSDFLHVAFLEDDHITVNNIVIITCII